MVMTPGSRRELPHGEWGWIPGDRADWTTV